MDEQELATLDQLFDTYTPRVVLQSIADVLERRAASALDGEDATTDDKERSDALIFRSSGRLIRNFSINV